MIRAIMLRPERVLEIHTLYVIILGIHAAFKTGTHPLAHGNEKPCRAITLCLPAGPTDNWG